MAQEFTDKEIEKYWNTLIYLFDRAINLAEGAVNQLKAINSPREKLIQQGLDALKSEREAFYEHGTEGIRKGVKRFPPGKRPGLGLSRGFSEILEYKENWEDSLMKAVFAAEDYFRLMGFLPEPEKPKFNPEDPKGNFSWKDKDKKKDIDR